MLIMLCSRAVSLCSRAVPCRTAGVGRKRYGVLELDPLVDVVQERQREHHRHLATRCVLEPRAATRAYACVNDVVGAGMRACRTPQRKYV